VVSVPERAAVTDLVINALLTLGYPVGDQVKPWEAGWSNDDPNTGDWTPYLVVKTTQMSQDRSAAGVFDQVCRDWVATYMVQAWGVSVEQVESIVTDAASVSWPVSAVFGTGSVWSFQRGLVDSVSGLRRDTRVNPNLWYSHMTLACSLRRTR